MNCKSSMAGLCGAILYRTSRADEGRGKRNILITSALPYVNNVPHLGNVIGSVLSADCFSRYCKTRGYQTLFICGTDEYGTATETKALEEGVTPQELCDKYNKLHKEVYDWFDIKFDHWGRTPTQQQTDIAQDIFTSLNNNGYLLEKTTLQPFCEHPKHMAFLADRYVEGICPKCGYEDARGDQCDKCGNLLDPLELGKPRCKLDGQTPVPRETKHMYLQLDKLQEKIDKWQHESYEKGKWSANGFNIAQAWIKTGLEARGITRDLKWGTPIPLPGYENKVMYVWFDACIGYVSITATYTEEWEKWWKSDDVQLYQFMGKDNVPFHAVVFPGSQIGTEQKWTMVHHISTTEYLNYEHGKFSKSRGVGVFGNSAKLTGISSDVWRYYLLAHRPETSDSEFEWASFVLSNNYLLNNLGNLVNRIIKFTNSKVYDGIVPDYARAASDPLFVEFRKHVNEKLTEYLASMEAVKLRGGLADAMAISQLGNGLLQAGGLDNKLATEQKEKCDALVGVALNLIHLLASLISPYLPATSASILKQLNAESLQIAESFAFDSIKAGHKIGDAAYLFTNVKADRAEEWRDQFGGEAARKAKEEAAKLAAEKKNARKKPSAKKDGDKEKEKAPAPVLTKEEEEAKKAAKKAMKLAKKEKGMRERPGAAAAATSSDAKQPAQEGKGVESAEKEGVKAEGLEEVEEVAEGIKKAVLTSS